MPYRGGLERVFKDCVAHVARGVSVCRPYLWNIYPPASHAGFKVGKLSVLPAQLWLGLAV